jgi:hypothetical protein
MIESCKLVRPSFINHTRRSPGYTPSFLRLCYVAKAHLVRMNAVTVTSRWSIGSYSSLHLEVTVLTSNASPSQIAPTVISDAYISPSGATFAAASRSEELQD